MLAQAKVQVSCVQWSEASQNNSSWNRKNSGSPEITVRMHGRRRTNSKPWLFGHHSFVLPIRPVCMKRIIKLEWIPIDPGSIFWYVTFCSTQWAVTNRLC